MSKSFNIWHGSRRWQGTPEIRPAKAGRAEWGAGIYGTTHFETAMSYAKGGGKVRLLTVGHTHCLEESAIPLSMAKAFVEEKLPKRVAVEILSILDESCTRMADRIQSSRTRLPVDSKETDWVVAEALRNLCVNFDLAAGARGLEVTRFFASLGIGYSMDRGGGRDGEHWVVIFDPSLIEQSPGYTYEEAMEHGHVLASPKEQMQEKPSKRRGRGMVLEP
jgi:hypothetical protein